jgi:lipoyl(octanoyl) transferase
MKVWRYLDTGSLPGALNMAIDQAILGLHANGKASPTLRLYQWTPPAVSLGYCQTKHTLDLEACRHLGIDVVRRPSGGRAVLHLGEITYSVIAGAGDGIPVAVSAAYRLICDGLLQGFSLLGIEAQMGGGIMKPPQVDICFLRGALGSILYQGRKFVGNAQTWHSSSMLQHGSIMLLPQIEALVSLWHKNADSPEVLRNKLAERMTSLQEILGRLPENEEIKAAIREGITRGLGVRFESGELTADEMALAQDIATNENEKDFLCAKPMGKGKFLHRGS